MQQVYTRPTTWLKQMMSLKSISTRIRLSKPYIPSMPSMVSLKSPNSWLPLSERSLDMMVGRRTYPIIPSTISLMNWENNFLKIWAPLCDFDILQLTMHASSSCETDDSVSSGTWFSPLDTISSPYESIKGSQNLKWSFSSSLGKKKLYSFQILGRIKIGDWNLLMFHTNHMKPHPQHKTHTLV